MEKKEYDWFNTTRWHKEQRRYWEEHKTGCKYILINSEFGDLNISLDASGILDEHLTIRGKAEFYDRIKRFVKETDKKIPKWKRDIELILDELYKDSYDGAIFGVEIIKNFPFVMIPTSGNETAKLIGREYKKYEGAKELDLGWYGEFAITKKGRPKPRQYGKDKQNFIIGNLKLYGQGYGGGP